MSAPAIPLTEFPDALPIGTVLGDFTVTRVIGLGGFGIVYMAHDNVLHRTVAIKEYLPITIAGRTSAKTVLVRSTRQTDTYVAGLQSFMREARLQARFTHPAMLEVYQVWEQHGTAYMAMRYYPGESLLDLREDTASNMLFDEEAIRRIMSPVFDGIAVLHAQNVLHRDVSPDNILIMPSGAPVLLDFGSARMVVVGAEQSLTTVLKPGYAPVEQYIDDGTMEQGPWTDVYALGAVLYFLAMGTPPPQAVTRMLGGTLHEFEASACGRYSDEFVSAVVASLTVQPTLRLQSVAALREALGWPDEPAADAVKSILVTTMSQPFNAEWRAAQLAVQAPGDHAVSTVASDAVTVLVSSPINRIDPVLPAYSNAAPVIDAATIGQISPPRPDDRPSKGRGASLIRSRWLIAASAAVAALATLAIVVQREPAASTTAAPSVAPTTVQLPPKLKLTETIREDGKKLSTANADTASRPETKAPSPEITRKTQPMARPRAASQKQSVEEVNAKESAAAATASRAVAAPSAAAIAPAAAARPAPPRQKSAACQRMLSKLAPSEAAITQTENGQLIDCK